jgi:hypothetical protein
LLEGNEPEPDKSARNVWRIGGIVLALVAIYVGYLLVSRWQENRSLLQKAAEQKAAKERDDAEKTVDTLGGNRFDIMSFYGSPGTIHRGDTAQLCYGVSNTKIVRLDPPVAEMWPSYDRCFAISPTKDTTYTLTADDGNGNSRTASFTIKVR